MTESVDFSKEVPIDFHVNNEAWSRYKLDDGTILMLRQVITKAFEIPDPPAGSETRYHTSASLVITTVCPTELRGMPTRPPPDLSHPDQVKAKSISFKAENEPWNCYELSDGTILMHKMVLDSVRRTEFFSEDGDPVYLLNWSQRGFRLEKDGRVVSMQGIKITIPGGSQNVS